MHARPSDEELVRAFRAGDDSAFDHLVERHMKPTYALAHRLTGNHLDADDLAQEAFIRAHRGLARFRGESRFSTWMARIVINLSRNPRRRHLPLAAAPEQTSAEDNADLQLVKDQQRQQVRRAVAGLPEKQRRTLLLRVFAELRYREIAEVMGTTTGTAKANVFHALRNLARRLEKP
ncbi:MAG: sigma-70 family RNA polymerase sigma factor [Acidobacteria bacterium]|nr:sigma-70 family RNA polymerase sigma factor [Acidobacteriota bacterium]